MNQTENTIITELNGERTELTEKEIALLLDYRMMDERQRKELEELIKSIAAEI